MTQNNKKTKASIKESETNYLQNVLYIEGKDQFRGWFSSSLVVSTILDNKAPYQRVLSHSFVVDEKGHKMSKSLGNVIDPEDVLKKFGADILRLWVISSDFTKEVKISELILQKLQESYQKIRNTFRFLLGNLVNAHPELQSEKDLEKKLNIIDYYIIFQLEKLIKESEEKFQEFNFKSIYFSLLNFCTNGLSSFYFEISKDSLYCDGFHELRRKQIITTLYYLLRKLLKIISPILPFLAEEVYQSIPLRFNFSTKESIYLVNDEQSLDFSLSNEDLKMITDFLSLRQEIYLFLEKARQEKIINTNSQARLEIYLKKNDMRYFSKLNLPALLLVSEIEIKDQKDSTMMTEGEYCYIGIFKSKKKKCARCWNWRDCQDEFCSRCQKVVNVANDHN